MSKPRKKKRRRWAVLAGVLIAVPGLAGMELRLSYIGSETDTALLGVSQGLSEAQLQGQFLGQSYTLVKGGPPSVHSSASAILAATDADTLKRLSQQYPTTPIFNLTLEDDGLRSLCLRNVLHIIPSRRMKQNAIAQWHRLKPGARVRSQAWHPGFEKYSGIQLNNRFRKNQGRPMDDPAWAGWAAVKMLADTAARTQMASPSKLLDYLKTQLSFDGQKGIQMSFRPDGQLRQMLLVVENDRVVAEAPVKGVVDSQDLDSLGSGDCAKP